MAMGALPTAALAHDQAFFTVKPIKLLPVHGEAFPLQQQGQPSIPEVPPLSRQISQAALQCGIIQPN